MNPRLSNGALKVIMQGTKVIDPVFQILLIARMSVTNTTLHRLLVSDGHFCCMCQAFLTDKDLSAGVGKLSVIRVKEYDVIELANNETRRLIVIGKVEVTLQCNIKLLNPTLLSLNDISVNPPVRSISDRTNLSTGQLARIFYGDTRKLRGPSFQILQHQKIGNNSHQVLLSDGKYCSLLCSICGFPVIENLSIIMVIKYKIRERKGQKYLSISKALLVLPGRSVKKRIGSPKDVTLAPRLTKNAILDLLKNRRNPDAIFQVYEVGGIMHNHVHWHFALSDGDNFYASVVFRNGIPENLSMIRLANYRLEIRDEDDYYGSRTIINVEEVEMIECGSQLRVIIGAPTTIFLREVPESRGNSEIYFNHSLSAGSLLDCFKNTNRSPILQVIEQEERRRMSHNAFRRLPYEERLYKFTLSDGQYSCSFVLHDGPLYTSKLSIIRLREYKTDKARDLPFALYILDYEVLTSGEIVDLVIGNPQLITQEQIVQSLRV